MIPVAFDYERATSVDDAIAKLGAGGGKLIAGGHSLVPLMKLRLSEPGRLIDIARIPGLSGIRESGGRIEIGATTVHHDIAASKLLRDKCPMIAEAAAEIGDPQVRNRGTIGGSIAHADPAADFPAVMLALDADIQIRGKSGARTVKASRFLPGLLHRGSAAVGDHHRACSSRRSRSAGVCQAAPARVALRGGRRGGGARRQGRRDPVGAHRRDRRDDARGAADRRRERAGRKEGGCRCDRRGVGAGRQHVADLNADLHASADYRQGDDSGVHAARAGEGALARLGL